MFLKKENIPQPSRRTIKETAIPSSSTYIDVSNSNLDSFILIRKFNRLSTITASNTLITDLKGVGFHKKLTTISLSGSPFASNEYYRIMLLISIGTTIKLIDGRPVSKEEIDQANKLILDVQPLLFSGWLLTSLQPITLINGNEKKIINEEDLQKYNQSAITKMKALQTVSMIQGLTKQLNTASTNLKDPASKQPAKKDIESPKPILVPTPKNRESQNITKNQNGTPTVVMISSTESPISPFQKAFNVHTKSSIDYFEQQEKMGHNSPSKKIKSSMKPFSNQLANNDNEIESTTTPKCVKLAITKRTIPENTPTQTELCSQQEDSPIQKVYKEVIEPSLIEKSNKQNVSIPLIFDMANEFLSPANNTPLKTKNRSNLSPRTPSSKIPIKIDSPSTLIGREEYTPSPRSTANCEKNKFGFSKPKNITNLNSSSQIEEQNLSVNDEIVNKVDIDNQNDQPNLNQSNGSVSVDLSEKTEPDFSLCNDAIDADPIVAENGVPHISLGDEIFVIEEGIEEAGKEPKEDIVRPNSANNSFLNRRKSDVDEELEEIHPSEIDIDVDGNISKADDDNINQSQTVQDEFLQQQTETEPVADKQNKIDYIEEISQEKEISVHDEKIDDQINIEEKINQEIDITTQDNNMENDQNEIIEQENDEIDNKEPIIDIPQEEVEINQPNEKEIDAFETPTKQQVDEEIPQEEVEINQPGEKEIDALETPTKQQVDEEILKEEVEINQPNEKEIDALETPTKQQADEEIPKEEAEINQPNKKEIYALETPTKQQADEEIPKEEAEIEQEINTNESIADTPIEENTEDKSNEKHDDKVDSENIEESGIIDVSTIERLNDNEKDSTEKAIKEQLKDEENVSSKYSFIEQIEEDEKISSTEVLTEQLKEEEEISSTEALTEQLKEEEEISSAEALTEQLKEEEEISSAEAFTEQLKEEEEISSAEAFTEQLKEEEEISTKESKIEQTNDEENAFTEKAMIEQLKLLEEIATEKAIIEQRKDEEETATNEAVIEEMKDVEEQKVNIIPVEEKVEQLNEVAFDEAQKDEIINDEIVIEEKENEIITDEKEAAEHQNAEEIASEIHEDENQNIYEESSIEQQNEDDISSKENQFENIQENEKIARDDTIEDPNSIENANDQFVIEQQNEEQVATEEQLIEQQQNQQNSTEEITDTTTEVVEPKEQEISEIIDDISIEEEKLKNDESQILKEEQKEEEIFTEEIIFNEINQNDNANEKFITKEQNEEIFDAKTSIEDLNENENDEIPINQQDEVAAINIFNEKESLNREQTIEQTKEEDNSIIEIENNQQYEENQYNEQQQNNKENIGEELNDENILNTNEELTNEQQNVENIIEQPNIAEDETSIQHFDIENQDSKEESIENKQETENIIEEAEIEEQYNELKKEDNIVSQEALKQLELDLLIEEEEISDDPIEDIVINHLKEESNSNSNNDQQMISHLKEDETNMIEIEDDIPHFESQVDYEVSQLDQENQSEPFNSSFVHESSNSNDVFKNSINSNQLNQLLTEELLNQSQNEVNLSTQNINDSLNCSNTINENIDSDQLIKLLGEELLDDDLLQDEGIDIEKKLSVDQQDESFDDEIAFNEYINKIISDKKIVQGDLEKTEDLNDEQDDSTLEIEQLIEKLNREKLIEGMDS